MPNPAASPASPAEGLAPVPTTGPALRLTRVLLSPWTRLSFLLLLFGAMAVTAIVLEPQRLLQDGWPKQLSGAGALAVFVVAYGLCSVAFVPRPLMSMAAGALFGSALGLVAAVGGTVLGAALSFGLGRLLGQDALRPLLRTRWLKAADGQFSRHGFRTILAVRLFPGVPFLAANYCAAVSRTRWFPFLVATGLGVIPNTAAYVVAGARAATPTSPVFLIAMGFLAVTGLAAAVVAWFKRDKLRGR
ncbi:TVP38/TMEM64 family protein [Streptomyces sp. NA04227]|uniref:TVP38/TMEM64 family protein n=1 Tax=Streptomyces sp. NA04227 TaxID=2742136 RepID=UPI0015916D88|nr:TVP38/TMEM64 family protein [Streptomyces sp. NA04227]QKW05358.1 TVP38/TMEM64 family protein [Streptomyces sp. NA04227]